MRLRFAVLLIALMVLSACGSVPNAAEGAYAKYLESEFGHEPDGVVPVQIEGESYDFRVWVGKKHIERIAVQASSAAAVKLAGRANKMTFGYVDRPLEEAPFREAATRHLADVGRTGCTFVRGLQAGRDRFSWISECASTATKTPASKTRK